MGGISGIYETVRFFFTDENVPIYSKMLAIGIFVGVCLFIIYILTHGFMKIQMAPPPTEEEIEAMVRAYQEEEERRKKEREELAELISKIEDPELRKKLFEKVMSEKEREYKEGYAKGYDRGYDEGYTRGFGSGYAAGED